MRNSLLSLLLCLVAIAVLASFQKPRSQTVETFRMKIRLENPGARMFYEFTQDDGGAEFHYEVSGDGQTKKGSGLLDATEASRFRAELNRRKVWEVPPRKDVKRIGYLTLQDGERRHNLPLSMLDGEVISWMFQSDSMLVRSMQKSLAK